LESEKALWITDMGHTKYGKNGMTWLISQYLEKLRKQRISFLCGIRTLMYMKAKNKTLKRIPIDNLSSELKS
jgi:hypothetical protein